MRALITGGSRGIGLGIAGRLASLGISTVLVSRSREQLEHAVRAVSQQSLSNPEKHSYIAGDVRSPALWENIKRSQKDIDILINAAGITTSSLLIAANISAIEGIIGTNLTGTALACRAMGWDMVRRKSGLIVNISSVLALNHGTGSSIYAASKAGIIGLSRALAAEYGPSGIRTNCILPGYIETDMTTVMTHAAKEQVLKDTPLRVFGRVEDVADAVEFVLKCGFVNGAEIVVDGGLSVA